MFEDLNDRQIQILNYIKKEIEKKGYPPAVREIGAAVGLSSSSTVHSHLSSLEKSGYIRRDPAKPRAIEILDSENSNKKELSYVPVVGRITAGTPILATENIEDVFPLPLDFLGVGDFFILNVVGDSMIEAGINDGDYVIIKKQNHAQNGEIIAALLEDDEATIKRFYKENNLIRLQPENRSMDPLIVSDVHILGKVTGVFRKIY